MCVETDKNAGFLALRIKPFSRRPTPRVQQMYWGGGGGLLSPDATGPEGIPSHNVVVPEGVLFHDAIGPGGPIP